MKTIRLDAESVRPFPPHVRKAFLQLLKHRDEVRRHHSNGRDLDYEFHLLDEIEPWFWQARKGQAAERLSHWTDYYPEALAVVLAAVALLTVVGVSLAGGV